MKLAALIILALFITLAVYLANQNDPPVADEKKNATAQKAMPSPTPPQQREQMKRLSQGPRQMQIPAGTPISAECRQFWKDLLALDLGDPHRSNPATRQCTPPDELNKLQENYQQNCLTKPITTDPQRQQCFLSLFYLRAYVNDYLTRDTPLDQIADAKVLVDKLFARFLKAPNSAVEIADRLLQVEPNFYPAAQASALAALLDYYQVPESARSADNPKFQALRAKLEDLQRRNPDDPQNFEFDIMVSTLDNENLSEVRNKAESMRHAFPQSAKPAYYLAWTEYKSGNAAKGWEWLQMARKLAPEDATIRETEARIRKNPDFYKSADRKQSSVFQSILSFNLQLPD